MSEDLFQNNNPAFAIPLSAKALELLGVIAVLWGQIDFVLDEMILFAHGLDRSQRKTFIGDKPIGAKADLLAQGLSGLHPKPTRAKAQRFLEIIQQTKQQRNVAFHGVWGWHRKAQSRVVTPEAFHKSFPKVHVKPEDFNGLVKRLSECSRIGAEVYAELNGWPAPIGSVRLLFNEEPEKASKWLEQSAPQYQMGRSPRDYSRGVRDTPPTAGPEED